MTWHDFLIIETSWNKNQGMAWLKYITIHLRINIGLQYIRNMDEYIPKLQLHQHSLLTMKVFSRHNLSTLLLCIIWIIIKPSLSSSHLHLQVIFIFNPSLSSSHLHHRTWIITRSRSSLDIITRSGSSLDLDRHWTSSLDLDHHC